MNKTAAARPTVNLRRAYFECRYGQLHVRTAFPSTGGFDESTPLVLLHPSPRSSRMLVPLLSAMGRDRSAYAIDTPGYGESDPPRARPAITDYAAAIGDFLDNLRLRRVDLLGVHTGAAIAAELALQRPTTVRRIVMVGIPLHTAAERAAFPAAPAPLAAAADGSHALGEWQRALAAQGGQSLAQVSAACADALRSGPDGWWGTAATVAWVGHERLAQVTQPTLVLRLRDELWEPTLRAQRLLRSADWQDLPDAGPGYVEIAADAVADRVRSFLDA